MLDLTSLENAVKSLKEALDEFNKNQSPFVKDSCIQRFEYTYELSHKMLKRQLESMSASPSEVDQMSFPELIRTGAEKGLLLNSWDVWKIHRDARNITSHAYKEKKADKVFADIPAFYEEACYLLKTLQERNTV